MIDLSEAQLRTVVQVHQVVDGTQVTNSAVGAEISHTLSRGSGWGTAFTGLVLLAGLFATLLSWGICRGLPALGFIADRRDEVWFWAAALLGNSLGSVLGDWLGDRWGLGFAATSALYAALLALLWWGRHTTRIDRRLLFWAAFVPSRFPF